MHVVRVTQLAEKNSPLASTASIYVICPDCLKSLNFGDRGSALGSNNVSIYASLGTQAYLCEKHQYVNIDHPSYIVMFIMY